MQYQSPWMKDGYVMTVQLTLFGLHILALKVFYKNKYVFLVANYRYMVFIHLSSYFVPLTTDIFPLDGSDHNIFHHFFSYPWSQLCSTCQAACQALTKCRIMRDVIHHKVTFSFFSCEHVFKVLNIDSLHIFNIDIVLPWMGPVHVAKKLGPTLVAFH
jgi:hypothetical protein